MVGIAEYAVVVPNHSGFSERTELLGYVSGGGGHAIFAGGVGDVAAALEEAVDGVVWGPADGSVEESVNSGGVGGEI